MSKEDRKVRGTFFRCADICIAALLFWCWICESR